MPLRTLAPRATRGLRALCATRAAPALNLGSTRRAFSSEPIKTALYDKHVASGGKMVDFAGYALPVQYQDSIVDSHIFCRESASLFDVSHMGQVEIRGKDALAFVESVVVGDIQALDINQARLSLITNANGGIIDDCIVTRKSDHIYMVVNGACKHGDMAHMQEQLKIFNEKNGSDVSLELLQGRSLVALQGPKAAETLQGLIASQDLSKIGFMYTFNADIGDVKGCWVTRCGYTGEDGFEISVPDAHAPALFDLLTSDARVRPCALGARDSLRLEAGLCLYGHDLNTDITPVEATLMWTISKRRRNEGGFLGHDKIMSQFKNKTAAKKRVGLEILKGAPAREGAEILDNDGNKIGDITSGTVSPILKKKISMGFIAKEFAKDGTEVQVSVRGKTGKAVVTKMPFVECSYYSPP